MMKKLIYTAFTPSEQLTDIITKVAPLTVFSNLFSKLDMIYIYVPT